MRTHWEKAYKAFLHQTIQSPKDATRGEGGVTKHFNKMHICWPGTESFPMLESFQPSGRWGCGLDSNIDSFSWRSDWFKVKHSILLKWFSDVASFNHILYDQLCYFLFVVSYCFHVSLFVALKENCIWKKKYITHTYTSLPCQ